MGSTLKLLADKHIFRLGECLPEGVELAIFDPADGLPRNLEPFDALFVRTETRIDRGLLGGKAGNLKLVASATSGIDHVDTGYLEERGIAFHHAPGCNSRSVAEYVITTILLWMTGHDLHMEDMKVGVAGVGHAGNAVTDLLQKLGFPYLAYDPPREMIDPDFKSCTLEELLQSDILTFHVPLTENGDHPTLYWLDREKLEDRNFELIINTSRGGVIDEKALYNAYQKEMVRSYILDVWENEPLFNDLLAYNAYFRTPHIAGYSLQSKWRASVMVAHALADFFSLKIPDQTWTAERLSPLHLPETGRPGAKNYEILRHLHPIPDYDQRFKRMIGLQPEKKRAAFRELRSEFPLRHEFSEISLPAHQIERYPILKLLGLKSE